VAENALSVHELETMHDLCEMANSNAAKYQDRHAGKPIAMQELAAKLKTRLRTAINMNTGVLLKVLGGCFKNRFDVCAEDNGMTFDEFCNLQKEEQIELICNKLSAENRFYGIRRVDFSRRIKNGFSLNYLAPHFGVASGMTKYGKMCAVVDLPSPENDVALKYDSLAHYYDENDQFTKEEEFCEDMVPLQRVELLISDKYLHEKAFVSDEGSLRGAIESDPIEILDTGRIDGTNISAVIISKRDYKELYVKLHSKKVRGEALSHEEEMRYRDFNHMRRVLARRGIRITKPDKDGGGSYA